MLLTLTTSIASAVSAYELTSVAKRIETNSFSSFEVYGVVTLMYLVISWMLMQIFAFHLVALLQLSGEVRAAMGRNELLFLLKGLKWTVALAAVELLVRRGAGLAVALASHFGLPLL